MAYNVPKFGGWNNGDDISYAISFENARKRRSSRFIIDANNLREIMQNVQNNEASTQPLHTPVGRTEPQKQDRSRTCECDAEESRMSVDYTVPFEMARKKKHHGSLVKASELDLIQNTNRAATIPKWRDWDKEHVTQEEKECCCCPWFWIWLQKLKSRKQREQRKWKHPVTF